MVGANTDGQQSAPPSASDDREAYAEIYRAHSSQVFTHFLQRGVARADAEDLTAEVFAIAWRRRAVVEPHPAAGMLPWLLGTANNLIKAAAGRSPAPAGRCRGSIGPRMCRTSPKPGDVDRVPTGGTFPVPPLVACVLPSGQAGIFPGDSVTCTSLGLGTYLSK